MSLNPGALIGAELPERRHSWTADDVILYQLGLGAGVPPTSPAELSYVYERGLKVLPTFGVLAASQSLLDLFVHDAFDADMAQVLHGEQGLTVHAPLPRAAEVRVIPRVSAVHDTGKHAVVVLETSTLLAADATPLCTNRFSLFVRGGGGFGGERGPGAGDGPPRRHPDHVVEFPTLVQQALIYRLSGDRNPLHADPEFAKRAGFERPILHGLCTYGIVARVAVEAALGGDVTRFSTFGARFGGIVLPGETLRTSIWEEAGRLEISVDVIERESTVLTGSLVTADVAAAVAG